MRDEIVSGLKNAMDRGSSLEQAAQSFINAGYNAKDIEEAANYLSQGAISVINEENSPKVVSKNSGTTSLSSTENSAISALNPNQTPEQASSQLIQETRPNTTFKPQNQNIPQQNPQQITQNSQILQTKPTSQVIQNNQLGTKPPIDQKGKKVVITLVIVLVVLLAILLLSLVFKTKLLALFGQ